MPPSPLYYGGQVADLLRDRGRIAAQREALRGRTLASAFQAAPQALAGFVQARDARRLAAEADAERTADRQWQGQVRARTMADWGREDAIRDAARMVSLGPDGQPDYGRIATEVGLIDPMAAVPYQQLAEADITKAKRVAQEKAETIAKELGATKDQATWDAALKRLETKGIRGVPRVFDVGVRDSSVAEALSFGQWLQAQTPKPIDDFSLSPGQTRFGPQGQVIASVPAATSTVTFGQPEIAMVNGKRDYVVRGSDNKWYLPNSDTPFTGRVQPLAETPAGRITPEQKNVAERWRMAETRRLDDYQRDAKAGGGNARAFSVTGPDGTVINFGGGGKAPLSDAEYKAAKREIENSYRKQIGESPLPEPRQRDQPWAPPMAGGRPSTRVPPFGPAQANAAPMSQRPMAPVTAPSTPTIQRPTPSAITTGPARTGPANLSPDTAPLVLPAGTAVGDTFVQDGRRFRVKNVTGQQVESEPVSTAPKVGDIIIDQGERVEIIAIENGQVRVREVR